MDVSRIFSRRGTRRFFQIFLGGKGGKTWFLPLQIKKTTFFAEMFKKTLSQAHAC